jgi:hypothetical protein
MANLKTVKDLNAWVDDKFAIWNNPNKPLATFKTFRAKFKGKPVELTFEDANEYDRHGEIVDVGSGVDLIIGKKVIINTVYGESGIDNLFNDIKSKLIVKKKLKKVM